jgi:hypothetical protein
MNGLVENSLLFGSLKLRRSAHGADCVSDLCLQCKLFGLPERRSRYETSTVSSQGRDDMTTQHYQVITKILVGAAIALGSCVGAAAPASADPNPTVTDPNPFGTLSCSCRETASPGSPALRDEIDRGIRAGLSTRTTGNRLALWGRGAQSAAAGPHQVRFG